MVSIEEYIDISTLTRSSVIGRFQTFVINFLKDKKEKNIAFYAEVPVQESDSKEAIDDMDDIGKSLELLTKKFHKMVKKKGGYK